MIKAIILYWHFTD